MDCHPVACAEKRMKADMPNLGSKRCRLNVLPGRCFGAMEKRRWASIVSAAAGILADGKERADFSGERS